MLLSSLNSRCEVAQELSISCWLNIENEIKLSRLRGKVVLLEFFQMLCPACVFRSLPQASLLADLFKEDDFQVIGLHSVFEHHHVMTKEALEVFISEFRLNFPIGIDRHTLNHSIPQTMTDYEVRGTPASVLIDKQGHIRASHMGHVREEKISAQIGYLLAES